MLLLVLGSNYLKAQQINGALYSETIKILKNKIDADLKNHFVHFDTRTGCYIKKITEEMSIVSDFGDADYFCLKIRELEYINAKNKSMFYLIVGGPAIDIKGELIENLPHTNQQAYAYYFITGNFIDYNKSGSQLKFKYNRFEFLTDRGENNTRLVCLHSNSKVVFLYQSTSFLGLSTNGFEFSSEYYIADLSTGYFSDRLNFFQTKNDNFLTFKNGSCFKTIK